MLTMKDIVREGHPALRTKAEDVALPASTEDMTILREMIEFVQNSQNPDIAKKYHLRAGVGIAAPQINVLKRMIAVHCTDEQENLISYALFNPKIISHATQIVFLTKGEGCLSVDRDVPGIVPRYAKVTITGTTLDGEEVKFRLKGLPAIVFQHEIDHLNGIMFYDHIDEANPYLPPEGAIAIES